jgi:hypothetical protein
MLRIIRYKFVQKDGLRIIFKVCGRIASFLVGIGNQVKIVYVHFS